jgi:hypothetical protein
MKDKDDVDRLCEAIQELFAKGGDDLKITATLTIQAWALMLKKENEKDAA